MIIFTVIIAISTFEGTELCDVRVTSTGKKRFNGFCMFFIRFASITDKNLNDVLIQIIFGNDKKGNSKQNCKHFSSMF